MLCRKLYDEVHVIRWAGHDRYQFRVGFEQVRLAVQPFKGRRQNLYSISPARQARRKSPRSIGFEDYGSCIAGGNDAKASTSERTRVSQPCAHQQGSPEWTDIDRAIRTEAKVLLGLEAPSAEPRAPGEDPGRPRRPMGGSLEEAARRGLDAAARCVAEVGSLP